MAKSGLLFLQQRLEVGLVIVVLAIVLSCSTVSARIIRQADEDAPEYELARSNGNGNGNGNDNDEPETSNRLPSAYTASETGGGGDYEEQPLGLPSNATSIRSNIVDTFSCQDKKYGYYADVDNDCQVFHICLPVTFPDDTEKVYRWSFICPEETIFNQESFTCARSEDAVPCADAPSFYIKNDDFGKIPEGNNNNNNVGGGNGNGGASAAAEAVPVERSRRG